MFKFESYITPVLLNYVGKYVKNFKPEQSQVSLWGGDATFQNLDLRLNVLNEQFDLPFSFVSGHIHELLIHVPWVKITSEPIVITINTIECILKMKDGSEKSEEFPNSPRPSDSLQVDAPSGYIKSIITKVVNNITINCNNLILKFVEEDIVLSVNIRFLSMQTVNNNNWQPSFTEVNGSDMILRKVVMIEDLTLCLDKMDSSGKIDIYQDPVVYRCSMTIRLIMNHQNSTAKRSTLTRFDVHCEKMEFSMTEQQIPMLLRLVTMLMSLQSKRADRRRSSSLNEEETDDIDEIALVPITNGWGTWAWDAVTSVLPVDWSDDLSIDDHLNYTGHTVNFGVYIETAVLTLKTVETVKESFTHKSLKIRYRPFLTLRLSGVVASAIQQGIAVTAFKIGIGSIQLSPRGACNCGFAEVKATGELPQYLFAGNVNNNYSKDSLFDEDSTINDVITRDYSDEIKQRLSSDKLAKEFFKNCPGIVIDFVHSTQLPEEINQNELMELNGNFEYSNFSENEVTRLLIGDIKLIICCGLLHRLSMITSAVEKSEVGSFLIKRIEPMVNELGPVTVEEYESLNDYVPMNETMIDISNLSITFQLADHRSRRIKEERNKSIDPRLLINFDKISGNIIAPMYPFRLAACASKQKQLSDSMLNQCYKKIDANVTGLTSKLHLSDNSQNSLIMPCNLYFNGKTLIYPQYWINRESVDVPRDVQDFRMDNLTITATKAKLIVSYSIVTSIFYQELMNPLVSSSLFDDAVGESNPPYLELSIENVSYSCITLLETVARNVSVGSVRIFALDDVQQAFVLSGPENSDKINANKLLSLSVKYPKSEVANSSVVISLKVSETRLSLDPLFLTWLDYQSKYYEIDQLIVDNHGTEETSSDNTSTRKKTFPSLRENVHSPSDKERKWNWMIDKKIKKTDVKSKDWTKKVTSSYFLWKKIGLICCIEPVVVYVPTKTMNGIEMNGIEEAKDRALRHDDLQIIVVRTARMTIRSANFSGDTDDLDENCASRANNFPWLLKMTEFHCRTLSKTRNLNFLRMESLNATIDATIKQNINSLSDASLNTLGFCIYVDTSPIIISCSEEQISLITEVLPRHIKIIQSNFGNQRKSNEEIDVLVIGQPAMQSPQIICNEETDTTSTASTSRNESDNDENPVIITAWIQWTITQVAFKVYSFHKVERKMVMRLEDIITSLDWQPVYVQLKNKVTTATICHYVKSVNHWHLGEFSGIIMCLGEQDDLVKGIEEDDFLTVTVTRAKSNNVYNKWSSYGKHQKKEYYDSSSSYITEVVIKLQNIEVILPADVLREYIDVFNISQSDDEEADTRRSFMPLIYADFKGITLVFPVAIKKNEMEHDTIVVRTESINVIPHADNPICRVILRQDIYELAAQANILNTPGSAVEDRQYEIKINDVLAYSTSWIHRQVNLTKRNAQASLYTMNENPALEWNNMMDNCDDSDVQFRSVTMAFDVCCIVAPPIIYKAETIVCGSAVEVTYLTDIHVAVSLDQVKLMMILAGQFGGLVKKGERCEKNKSTKDADKLREQEIFRKETECLREYGQDSGVDVDMSSTDVGCHLPTLESKVPMLPPFEYLMNFGKISLIIYEASRMKANSQNGCILPLLSVVVNQPNTYISQQNLTRTFQINCFDLSVSFPDEEHKTMESIPTITDFKKLLIEAKNGDPHPNTGIPPSFMIIKLQNTGNKNSVIVDMGRPTRINLSLPLIDLIDSAGRKLLDCISHTQRTTTLQTFAQTPESEMPKEENLLNLSDLNVTTKQIVLVMRSDSSSELIMSLSSLSAGLTNKPRRMNGSLKLTSAMITTNVYGNFRALLNPMSCSLFINVMWESWNDANEIPQTRIQAFSENIRLDIGPEQLRVLRNIQRCIELLKEKFATQDEAIVEKKRFAPAEQHYQDDLKVGAFQFIDGGIDEMPLPYQVIFSNYPNQTMVWRYPQPRILTRLHINPVLLTIIEDSDNELENILCVIEFWSDTLTAYQRYIEFPIIEMKKPTFQLPNKFPTRAVACVWRLTLYSASDLDSRTLAGCLRVDSYFNSSLISGVEVTLSIKSIDLALYNHIDTSIYRNLTSPLDSYKLNNIIPSTQCFSCINTRNVLFVFNRWEDSLLLDVSGSLSIQIMDYAYLKMQTFLDEVAGKLQISKSDQTNVVAICQDVWLRFGPEISHTLTLSFNLWMSALEDDEKIGKNNGVVLSRIVVANNCNGLIRFGQSQSPDDYLLRSFECHFYTWCHDKNQSMRIAMKHTGWNWSRSFNVKRDGIKQIIFDKCRNSGLHVNIKSLSPTQKLITFCGQLIVCNKLVEDFELRLLKYDNASKTKKIISEDGSYVINSKKPLSMIIDEKENFAIRLRFLKSSNSQWTGDIPLHANAKCDQPWLVKVPNQGRDKFLSIWVRIVQESNDYGRILVILSPLYMVRSYLPVDVGIKLETPTLSTSFDTTIKCCGELQQLNCPGTFENYHQLTFHTYHEISTLQTSIPVSYNCVDQRTFFKRPQKEDIDEILKSFYTNTVKSWPFKDEDENVWKPVRQGRTHAFIRYQDAGLVSSTLLFEIRPWSFIMNSLGRTITIVTNDDDVLTEIPHRGVAAPPKLDGIFKIQIEIDDDLYSSMPLQLATSEWNRGFIMPQISGLIPLEGTIRVSIDCRSRSKCHLTVNSSIQEEIRILRIMTSHIVCNFTNYELSIATLSANSSPLTLPDLHPLSFNAPPSPSKKAGIPITQWYQLASLNITKNNNETPFICLNAGFGWSCPVKVDQAISRNCVAIPYENTSIPVVITTQKDKEITYIVVSDDEHPQLMINNNTSLDLIIGAANSSRNGIEVDSPPFSWSCEIPSGKSSHYTVPTMGKLIPDVANAKETKSILFLTARDSNWHKIIELPVGKPIRFDQYVQIDSCRDLKIMVESRGHTVHITVEPKSQIEVSVRDIRSRLALEETSKSQDTARLSTTIEFSDRVETLPDISLDNEPIIQNDDKFFTFYIKGINLVVSQDSIESQKIEVASFYFMNTIINSTTTIKSLSLSLMISDLQFDNQMFEQGGFDFPVVLISQKPTLRIDKNLSTLSSLETTITELRKISLFTLECFWEKVDDKRACKSVHVRISPINIYIEDKYVTQLLEYATSMVRPCLIMSTDKGPNPVDDSENMNVPANIIMDARIMSSPLRIQSLIIEPISILLSVHTSVRLYVALDHSPLHFGVFERQYLFTTPYRLGNALTMHYLSGAIFGAGWVVGSLEILGSPGSFAQALGSGLKDFIALPFQGLLQGPWGFIVGITHGSASLMKNITAGTVNSVTKLASSVARNLDRLTLDEEHVQRQEESRRTRPQGMAQGLYQGLTGFGISILAAVAGLAHHPLQNLLNGEASAKGLMTGVGLGLVGVVTKPLSGAAELVALTGQGLLQRTGWNSLPSARRQSVNGSSNINSLTTRYLWKLASLMLKNCDNILYLTDANFIDIKGNNCDVTIIITRYNFIVINKIEDKIYKLFNLKELSFNDDNTDPSSFRLNYSIGQQQRYQSESPSEKIEMDHEMRSRVEQYVISNSGLISCGDNDTQNFVVQDNPTNYSINSLNFYLESGDKNYLKAIMKIVKRQSQGIDFTVL